MPVKKSKGTKNTKKTAKSSTSEQQELENKINLAIKDLETQHARMEDEIIRNFEETRDKINNYAATLKLMIPKNILKMTWEELKGFGNLEELSNLGRTKSSHLFSKFMKGKAASQQTELLKRLSTSKKSQLTMSKRKSLTARKRKSTIARKKVVRALPSRPLSTRAGAPVANDDSYAEMTDDDDDEVFFTPSVKSSSSALQKSTITPKFDPKRPLVRSELRRARPGEIAVSLSGSPLLIEGDGCVSTSNHSLTVSIGKKKFHFSDSQVSKGVLDMKQRQDINNLQKQLSLMLRK